MQIKALEEELGVRLFDRMGKRVILTAQGQCFLEYANSILDTIHNARRALSEDAELEGCLHIGTLESLCFFRLPGLMHQFRVEHPKVSLRVTTGSPEELIEKMERGEVDLICILDEPRYSNSWHKCNEVPEEVVFVASRTSTSATPARTGWQSFWTSPSSSPNATPTTAAPLTGFWLPARSS